MAKTANDQKLLEKIKAAIANVRSLKNDRQDVSAQIQAEREALVAAGIPKKAFDMAMSYMNMDPDDREGFDVAYALVREAGGLPITEDLFAAADRKQKEADEEWKSADPKGKEADAAGIQKVITSQENEKTKGKKVHEPAGEHQGSIN